MRDRDSGREARPKSGRHRQPPRQQAQQARDDRPDTGHGRARRRAAHSLIAQCFVSLEWTVVARRSFVLEVVKAWLDPARKKPKTFHHRGFGTSSVDGETLTIKARMP